MTKQELQNKILDGNLSSRAQICLTQCILCDFNHDCELQKQSDDLLHTLKDNK
jgi:hypothetical protein